MTKDTLKILRCQHRKIFKVRLAILQHMHEGVNVFLQNINLKGYHLSKSKKPEAYLGPY